MQKILEKTKWFFESKYSIILLGLYTLISYMIDIPYACYYVLAVIVILMIVSKAELYCAVPIVFIFCASWRTYVMELGSPFFWGMVFLLAIAAGFFVYYTIKNYKEFIQRLKGDWLLVCYFAILATMLLSMINAPVLWNAGYGIAYFVMAMVMYFFPRMLINNKERAKEQISFSFVFYAIILSLEMFFILLLEMKNGNTLSEILGKKNLPMVWIHQNHLMAILNICFIVSIYYFIIHKDVLHRIFTLVSMAMVAVLNILMACRAGWIGLFVSLILVVILYVHYHKRSKTKQWKKDLPYFGAILGCLVLGLIVMLAKGYIQEIITHLKNLGFSSNGRNDVYAVAWDSFKKHPIIGAGAWSCHYYLDLDPRTHDLEIWNYHNHILQALATTGILGGIAFVAYFVFSIKRSIEKNLFSGFTFIVIVYFLVHGCLDTLYFQAYIMPLLSILLALGMDSKWHDLLKPPYGINGKE